MPTEFCLEKMNRFSTPTYIQLGGQTFRYTLNSTIKVAPGTEYFFFVARYLKDETFQCGKINGRRFIFLQIWPSQNHSAMLNSWPIHTNVQKFNHTRLLCHCYWTLCTVSVRRRQIYILTAADIKIFGKSITMYNKFIYIYIM